MRVKTPMSAYDFHVSGTKTGSVAGNEERAEGIAERIRRFAQDIVDGKIAIYTIEVSSRMAIDEVLKTELKITFTELAE